MRTDRPAVIMGLSPTGLASLRSLASMGVPCLGVYWNARNEIGRHSKHLIGVRQVSYPPSDDELVRALDELTAAWRGSSPVLFPASDVYARFIDEMQDELRPRYTFRCSPERLHARLADKAEAIAVYEDRGVPIPKSAAIGRRSDVAAVRRDFRFPVIVKPLGLPGIEFPGKNYVADGAGELGAFFEEHPHLLGQAVAQEVIDSGDERIAQSISYSGRDGEVLAQATIRKIRQWRPDYGVTSFGRSEWLPEMAQIARRFLNGLGYQGFAAIEFAEERGTGRYFLLEVNPRLNLPTQLVLDAEVDLVRTAYREMCDGASLEAEPFQQIDGIHWVDFRFDLQSFLEKYRERAITLPAWLRSLPRASSYATWDRRDPKPFFASTLELMRDLLGLLRGWVGAGLRGRS